ncbi:MAG TPA: hypothetical protein VF074_13705, partial [Pyrinomonadaceae bacterium]
ISLRDFRAPILPGDYSIEPPIAQSKGACVSILEGFFYGTRVTQRFAAHALKNSTASATSLMEVLRAIVLRHQAGPRVMRAKILLDLRV